MTAGECSGLEPTDVTVVVAVGVDFVLSTSYAAIAVWDCHVSGRAISTREKASKVTVVENVYVLAMAASVGLRGAEIVV